MAAALLAAVLFFTCEAQAVSADSAIMVDAQTGRVEMDLEQAGKMAFALPVSGVHEVSVRVDEGR